MKSAILIFLVFVCAQNTQACQELIWSADEYANNSNLVYIGLINSMRMPESKGPIDIKTYINSRRILGDIDVTLKVIQPLKGESVEMLQIPLNWCRGGQYELGDLVVAYKLGEHWHVKNTKLAIEQSIKALTNKSSGRGKPRAAY